MTCTRLVLGSFWGVVEHKCSQAEVHINLIMLVCYTCQMHKIKMMLYIVRYICIYNESFKSITKEILLSLE